MKQSVAEFAGATNEKRERDLHMLEEVIGATTRDNEIEAFGDMLDRLESLKQEELTDDQRSWVEDACEREGVDTTPRRLRKPVPRGNEVPIAPVLQNLPKRPPNRRT